MTRILLSLSISLLLLTTKAYAQAQPIASPLKIAQVSLLVKDYDEALQFYTNKLNFAKTADTQFGNQRWLTIAPPGQKEMALVLVKAVGQSDIDLVGKQAGSRTLLVLETDHFDQLYRQYQEKGVPFLSKPSFTGWGRQVQFSDLYGNHLVLLEVKSTSSSTH
jgi:predicted enzyme related to lactoylglutathione lyase